jgi:hypothetical protein
MVDEAFREYTSELVKLIGEKTRIYPIQLCNDAYSIGCGLKSYQFIRAYQGILSLKDNLDYSNKIIKTEILHDCARLLKGFQPIWKDKPKDRIPSPVKLFLSHAKLDGLETTKKFKAFIDSELKLDVFFDTVDIADGYEFEKQIESNITDSAFVVFHTDEYSAREWCRIEVLIAKRNKCSIVVVHDIKKGEKRAFPYLGNTPTITIRNKKKDCFYEIVDLTLHQVINKYFQNELLASFVNLFATKGTDFVTITTPPELFNFIDFFKQKSSKIQSLVVLYPEPPLGNEELRMLNELDKDVKFITPILLPTV